MNWDDIRIFLAVARAGTLTAAARTAGVDGTTVARRLQRLEGALSATLFEHGPAGHLLTEAGSRFLVQAEAMEAGARSIQQDANAGAGQAGTIRVSASEGFGTWIIANRLASFTALYPGIAVDLIASTGFLNPSRREADVAIMLARPRGGPLIASKLTDYRLGVYAAKAYLERTGPVASIAELKRRRLVGYVSDLIYAPELRYLADIDDDLEASLRSTSISAQARLIACGAGVGILPCFVADTMTDLTRLLPGEVSIQRSFWLVVHRDMRSLARIVAFIDWLRAEVAVVQPLLRGAQGDRPER